MGFKLLTDDKLCVVYRKDKVSNAGNPYTTYCTKVSSKDKDGNWQSAFIDIAFKKGVEVNNKAKINIKNSFPVLNTYNDKTTIRWMILDFDVINQGEVKPDGNIDSSGFMNIDSDIDDEVPFN